MPRRGAMLSRLSPADRARGRPRQPWLTIGAWLVVLAVAMVLMGTLLGDALTTELTLTNNPESVQADDLLRERLGGSSGIDESAIVRSATLTVDDPAYRSYVEALFGDLSALG